MRVFATQRRARASEASAVWCYIHAAVRGVRVLVAKLCSRATLRLRAQTYGIWPFSGEIDILEGSGFQTEFVCGIHFGGPWSARANLATRTNCPATAVATVASDAAGAVAQSGPCGNRFHTWALEWRVNYVSGVPMATLTWLLDGTVVKTLRSNEWWTNVPVCTAGVRLKDLQTAHLCKCQKS